ncbi:MAG: TolC family protein [Candidatus Melainabacteria bacterium]|nr:TolC family protein [Candidatus Melainabacteria bacterium]
MRSIVQLVAIVFYLFLISQISKAEPENIQGVNEEIKLSDRKEEDSQNNQNEVLTLKKAIDLAMENNHHVKSAIATLPVAEANVIIAKYRPNPYVFSYRENAHGGAFHPADAGKEFEVGRKRYWRVKLAKEQVSKRELEIAKILWEVHTQVHSTYASLSVGLDLYKLAKARTEFYESLVDISGKRFQAGDISRLELDRAKMQLLSAENDLSEFTGRLKKAKVDFNHILGRESDAEMILEEPEKLKPKIKIQKYKPLENIVSEALSKRLEMAILEKDFGITRAQLKKAEWERLPNLKFETGPVKPNVSDNKWGIYTGLGAEVPLFNRKQGEIKQAKAQVEYLEKERERIEHDINIEVANSLQDLQVREEQVQRFQDKLLSQSENILEMIKTGYQKGKLSLTDVLNAEQQNRDLRQNYLSSLLNYQFGLASLEYAVGVPLYGLTEQ